MYINIFLYDSAGRSLYPSLCILIGLQEEVKLLVYGDDMRKGSESEPCGTPEPSQPPLAAGDVTRGIDQRLREPGWLRCTRCQRPGASPQIERNLRNKNNPATHPQNLTPTPLLLSSIIYVLDTRGIFPFFLYAFFITSLIKNYNPKRFNKLYIYILVPGMQYTPKGVKTFQFYQKKKGCIPRNPILGCRINQFHWDWNALKKSGVTLHTMGFMLTTL